MKPNNLIIALILIYSCNSPDSTLDNLPRLFNGQLEILDLTHALNSTSPSWGKGQNPFNYKIIAAHDSGLPILGSYSTPEHYGTHIDAPIHSADGQLTVDQLTTDQLFAPGIVIDVSVKSEKDPDYLLQMEDILKWEEMNGPIPDRAVVLLYTGWSKKWEDHAAFKNVGEDEKMHFPGFSKETAEFLVNERAINGIGIDNMSIDFGLSERFEVHKITNGAGKFHLENLANLHQLPVKGFYLIIAPIKLESGSGGQVRVFAVISE